ncbi:MAG TPA: biotin/lipoyl-binding protein [Kofleriaceae bacterium]|nr:biotin/lipoyl-binding protein [Kofleriaceae bacterium]
MSHSHGLLEAAPPVRTEPGSIITPPPARRPRSTPREGTAMQAAPPSATPAPQSTRTPEPAQPTRTPRTPEPAQPTRTPHSAVASTRTPPSAAAPQSTSTPHSAAAPQSTRTPHSVAAPQPTRTPHSVAAPQPTRTPHSVAAPQPTRTPHSAAAPQQTRTPHSAAAGAPPSGQHAPQAAQTPGMPGIGAIDPLAIMTPPELAGPIYGHIRRLALQADLAGADRVLRDALAELTSSLSCSIIYPGQDGMWTLGNDDEMPRDPQPLIAVATARRAVIASHLALIPVVTTSETVAVITLTRNPRQPAYQVVEQIAMVALAREAAPILHHLAVQHLARASEIKADQGSLYRGEALEAHRTRGQEGTLVQLSPNWVKRAYPILVVTMLAAIVFAVFIKVPTYSTGTAVVLFEGSTSVTASLGGTVDKVFVKDNEAVKKGDPLLRLNSPEEAAQLAQAEAEWRDTQIQFLFDQTDEQIRKSLMTAATSRDHALARIEARTIRAPRDGVVTNLHVKEGVAVQPGGYVMQITDENSEIEVLSFLPGKDGPRIRDHMAVQLELDGYTKARAIATITHVQPDAVSGTEAAKLGGDMLVESIAKELSAGTWITVRARLPSRTFKTEHNTYHYHHGMHAKVEVKVQSKPFLVTLLPALEKYVPE